MTVTRLCIIKTAMAKAMAMGQGLVGLVLFAAVFKAIYVSGLWLFKDFVSNLVAVNKTAYGAKYRAFASASAACSGGMGQDTVTHT
jgi:hypothetical protein